MRFIRVAFTSIVVLAASHLAAQLILPPPPPIAAEGFVLMDARTHTVLMEKNSREKLPPASLTKIMTSYVAAAELAAGAIKLDDDVPVSEEAWRAIGSRMFIDPNTKVKLEDLLRGVVIQSGNDASIAVAEHIAGTEDAFAIMMNQTAKALGMEDSNFVNSTGLPHVNHHMSARDVAILSDALIRDFPEHYKMYAELEFEYNNIKQPNRNRLLTLDPTVDGVKTGYTEAAGYCLAVSAKREDMRLISVVMGAASQNARTRESRKLLNFGFRNYRTRTMYEQGEAIGSARVIYGLEDSVPVHVGESITKTMFQRLFDDVQHELILPTVVEAPVFEGQEMGEMRVWVGDEELGRVPLFASKAVEEKGLFGRIWDSVLLMFENVEDERPSVDDS